MTVFASDGALSKSTQELLAKDCEWESVMVSKSSDDSSTEMSFHMPSGEEVSFCAHAAMGGAYACFEDAEQRQRVEQHHAWDVALYRRALAMRASGLRG